MFEPDLPQDLGIYLTYARPGMGKSLDMVRTAFQLWNSYRWQEKKYPDLPKRAIYSNMKFSPEIEAEHLGKDLFYWTSPRIMVYPEIKRDIDIIWDDIGIQIPSDGFRDLDPEIKRMLILYRHRGLRIFANCQDYKMVDITFRRMLTKAWKVEKVLGSRNKSASLPPVKYVWGLIIRRQFDPDTLENANKNQKENEEMREDKIIEFLPDWFYITKKLIQAYDTTEEIEKFVSYKLGHLEWTCENPECSKKHIEHFKLF